MFDSRYYKSRTHVYPHYPPRHISGITPKKFLRRPLHPSQELHCCSGIWTPVRLNKSGQLHLTLRSVSCYSCQKIVFLITEVPYTFNYTNRRLTCNCSAPPLSFQRMLKGYPHDWSRPWAANTEPKHGLRPPQNRVSKNKMWWKEPRTEATLRRVQRRSVKVAPKGLLFFCED